VNKKSAKFGFLNHFDRILATVALLVSIFAVWLSWVTRNSNFDVSLLQRRQAICDELQTRLIHRSILLTNMAEYSAKYSDGLSDKDFSDFVEVGKQLVPFEGDVESISRGIPALPHRYADLVKEVMDSQTAVLKDIKATLLTKAVASSVERRKLQESQSRMNLRLTKISLLCNSQSDIMAME
jgi:hypothetical protein